MSKPVLTQTTRPPAPKNRAAAAPAPKQDARAGRKRAANSPASAAEGAAALVAGLEPPSLGGYIWS